MQNAEPQNTECRTAIGRTVTESVQKKKAVEMLILNVLVKDKSTPESFASSQQNKHINRELVRSDLKVIYLQNTQRRDCAHDSARGDRE